MFKLLYILLIEKNLFLILLIPTIVAVALYISNCLDEYTNLYFHEQFYKLLNSEDTLHLEKVQTLYILR